MNKNNENTPNKEQSGQHNQKPDPSIQDACQQYHEHRAKAEQQISQGAQLTKHQIKL